MGMKFYSLYQTPSYFPWDLIYTSPERGRPSSLRNPQFLPPGLKAPEGHQERANLGNHARQICKKPPRGHN